MVNLHQLVAALDEAITKNENVRYYRKNDPRRGGTTKQRESACRSYKAALLSVRRYAQEDPQISTYVHTDLNAGRVPSNAHR